MKAYAGERDKESVIECSEVEIMCNRKELETLIEALMKFRDEINIYIQNNKASTHLGITHMHYQDNTKLWKEDDTDVVVYVDLDE